MPLTITATVGASNANSFVTEAEMDAWVEGKLNAGAWTSDAAALPALVEATRYLNEQPWAGFRVTTTQALQWPREYAPVPVQDRTADDVIGESGVVEYATNVIPQRVKDATCALALEFLRAGTTDLTTVPASEGVKRTKVDVIEKEYFEPGTRTTRGLGRWPYIQALVAPLLAPQGSALRVVRV